MSEPMQVDKPQNQARSGGGRGGRGRGRGGRTSGGRGGRGRGGRGRGGRGGRGGNGENSHRESEVRPQPVDGVVMDDASAITKKHRNGANNSPSNKRPKQSSDVDSSAKASKLAHITEHKFSELDISASIRRSLAEVFKYEFMTVVQSETLPLILKGDDCLAKAKTGTGKVSSLPLLFIF